MSRFGFALLAVVVASPLAAQEDMYLRANPAMTPRLKAAVDLLKADNAWTLEQQRTICEIPAPPFKEQARGLEMKRRFEALGYRTRIDSIGNVIAERRGDGSWPTLVVAGHLDTVFPEGTDVTVKTSGTRMRGPGISDDCRGLAVILSVARAYARAQIENRGTVYFVANVGEEGPGNLRGTRHLFERTLKDSIDAFISVDGGGEVSSITHHGVGSVRYKVTFKGPGGHSYGAFGTPNPIHALGRAIAMIGDITVPSSPRTTFNVGIIEGGTSVNSIPFEGSAQIDMRSTTAEELQKVNAQVLGLFAKARDAENARWNATDPKQQVTFVVDTIGIRPANSSQNERTPIVTAATTAAKQLGLTRLRYVATSTDANYPLSIGVPAITVNGGGTEDGSHSLDEWYDDGADGWLGPQFTAILIAIIVGLKS
ncbi:MAG TPA: M20/M25/M40 family metallo-hydrolase [Gemmatimonadaceae bacterium]|nr:M20/M25/M40 family metallo-hydrolase [Gemmatimonadaceae bacterium]